MKDWFLKLLGFKCCGEWSEWEKIKGTYTRPCLPDDGMSYVNGTERIAYTKTWQERKCLNCGRIQQSNLEH